MTVEQTRPRDDQPEPEPVRTRPTPPRRTGWDVYRDWCADNEADLREMARWER